MVGRAVVFMFMPTAVELVLVCGLLYYSFGPAVVGIVLATFTMYVAWTVHMTSVSAGLRKVGRCRLSVSNVSSTELKAPMVSALEATI
jgi:ABC-type transport system involved in Fe-S cluster assembly fused permease/ATPase subunit